MNFKLASEISQLLDTNQLLGHPYIWSRIKVVIVSSGEPENVGRALVERNDLQEKTKSNNLGHFSIVAKVEESGCSKEGKEPNFLCLFWQLHTKKRQLKYVKSKP